MSDRWGNLRDRFKKKDIDLDAEFEKFLNEVRICTRYTRTVHKVKSYNYTYTSANILGL